MSFDDRPSILNRYDRIRRDTAPVVHHLLNKRAKSLPACARELGFWDHGMIATNNETEMAILMDFCLYYPVNRFRNIAEQCLAEADACLDEPQQAILKGMAKSHYSVFEIVSGEPDWGVTVRDLIGAKEWFVVDRNLGRGTEPGHTFGMRLMTIDGVTHCTGAALPTVPIVIEVLGDRLTHKLAARLNEPGFILGPHEQTLLARLVITACLQAGVTEEVAYV